VIFGRGAAGAGPTVDGMQRIPFATTTPDHPGVR
jgi:hypothetical protein